MPNSGSKARITHSVQQDLENLEMQAREARGPDIYVIRAMSSVVSSLFRLESAVDKNTDETTRASSGLVETIKELDRKNTQLQRTALGLAAITTILTIVQIIQIVK